MLDALETLLGLLWGTLVLRWFVVAFLAAFLVAGVRDLGPRGVLAFLLWGWVVAFAAEYASTRVGIPFGLYHYVGNTRGAELFVSNVPFFDPLSFPFLAYASLCLARWALGPGRRRLAVTALAGVLMMLLDIVIDPLAVRGDRWFLGRMFYYPAGGAYFGVPLSNFAGWLLVGWIIVGGYLAAAGRRGRGSTPGAGIVLYGGVLAFNLTLTWWIGEPRLFLAGLLVHLGGFLLVCGVRVASRHRAIAPRGGALLGREGPSEEGGGGMHRI